MTHTLELSIPDRLKLLSLLPQQGGLIRMKLTQDLSHKIGFSAEEIQAFELNDAQQGMVTWNPHKAQSVRLEITDGQLSILKEAIQDADKREVITLDMLPLVEQIEGFTTV